MGPAFGRHEPRCAPRAPVALSCPPIQLSVSRVAASGGELAAPWPSCAPCGPSAPVAYPVPPAGREASRLRTPPDAARGVPAASRPAHGGGSNAPLGQAPPPKAGFACGRAAATPAVGRWVRGLSCCPSRLIRYSRACGLASNAVRCEHSPHLPAFTVQVPASLDLAATCSPHCSARTRPSRAPAGFRPRRLPLRPFLAPSGPQKAAVSLSAAKKASRCPTPP